MEDTIKLFFVRYSDCDGNHDSLVEAESKWHAIDLWREQHDFDRHHPDWLGEVHLTGQARFIPWEEINQ